MKVLSVWEIAGGVCRNEDGGWAVGSSEGAE